MDIKQLEKFYEKLQDDESRMLFNAKYNMLFEKKFSDFVDMLINMNYQWEIDCYDDFRPLSCKQKILIFGAGAEGRMTYNILKKNNIDIYKFCDNDVKKQGTKINDIEIISVQQVLYEEQDSFVIIASSNRGREMLSQLLDARFPRKNIWYPRLGVLFATTGQQYFDCPNLDPIGDEEVFIDAGCFDASTSKAFKKWSGGKYKRIIALEPDSYNYKKCLNECMIKNFELFPYAAWNERKELNFSSAGSGSRVNEDSEVIIQAESIDNILNGEKATFIKMDVEGAELKALKGAQNTIKNYKPRLAICIYHRLDDVYQIPLLLMEYRHDYRFYIRHYTNCIYETVLYAI